MFTYFIVFFFYSSLPTIFLICFFFFSDVKVFFLFFYILFLDKVELTIIIRTLYQMEEPIQIESKIHAKVIIMKN